MKKLITLFLVLSILILSGNLIAKVRRGADVKIYKTTPQMEGTPRETPHIRGELIAVKQSSLLLLGSEGADVTVDLNDIQSIKIMPKLRASTGGLYGLLVGGLFGFAIGYISNQGGGFISPSLSGLVCAVPGSVFGLLGGACIGAEVSRSSKTIQFEGKSDSEIQEILEELRKKARIQNIQ